MYQLFSIKIFDDENDDIEGVLGWIQSCKCFFFQLVYISKTNLNQYSSNIILYPVSNVTSVNMVWNTCGMYVLPLRSGFVVCQIQTLKLESDKYLRMVKQYSSYNSVPFLMLTQKIWFEMAVIHVLIFFSQVL